MNKKCPSCKKYQPKENFHVTKNRKDGLSIYCKTCSSKRGNLYYHDNKQQIRECSADYYKKNKDSVLDRNKQYAIDNKEQIQQYARKYYKQHPYVPKNIDYCQLFVNKSKIKHNNKYDYSLVEYVDSDTKVNIVCPIHGIFKVTPRQHMYRKTGCNKCAVDRSKLTNTKTTEQFIIDAIKVHGNKYSYEHTEYINAHTPLRINCLTHGIFQQAPNVHTYHKAGCPSCINNSHSTTALQWLNEISNTNNIFIQHAGNIGEYAIPHTRFKADGYCKETNTIYEFYGDAFHGNLNVYESTDTCHPFDKSKTAEQLNLKTITREQKIKELGYTVVSIWESDFLKK